MIFAWNPDGRFVGELCFWWCSKVAFEWHRVCEKCHRI